jgi:hypothetical protein
MIQVTRELKYWFLNMKALLEQDVSLFHIMVWLILLKVKFLSVKYVDLILPVDVLNTVQIPITYYKVYVL